MMIFTAKKCKVSGLTYLQANKLVCQFHRCWQKTQLLGQKHRNNRVSEVFRDSNSTISIKQCKRPRYVALLESNSDLSKFELFFKEQSMSAFCYVG